MHLISPRPVLLLAAAALSAAAPAAAQRSDWGYPGPAERGFPDRGPQSRQSDDREGRVTVARFVGKGDAASRLGHGPAFVKVLANDDSMPDASEQAIFEAAVIDRLVGAGYDTLRPEGDDGQMVELRILHAVLTPQEAPHKPVSGEMAVGVSNRGSMVGMAVNVDLTKPRKALLSTRLEARIRDQASGEVLWEGRAEIATRDGDEDWGEDAIAHRLAQVLFSGFPHESGETIEAG